VPRPRGGVTLRKAASTAPTAHLSQVARTAEPPAIQEIVEAFGGIVQVKTIMKLEEPVNSLSGPVTPRLGLTAMLTSG